MQTVKTVSELRSVVKNWRQQDLKIAFVPTMGNLHEGHLQLVKKARELADKVVVSIFVNPMQFGVGEDFETYPRTEEADSQKLVETATDCLFLPAVIEVYPGDIKNQTRVEVPGISDILCGASRPDHFVGVTTVVSKLFNMVQPDLAVFGQKDFQQLMIIRRMAHDLSMPIEIVGVPTQREQDGLAMSSRNGYLDEQQRSLAPKLYETIKSIGQKIRSDNKDFSSLQEQAASTLNESGFRTDYFEIRNKDTLSPADETDESVVILAAAFLGNTRLIDNLVVTQ